MHRLGGHGTHAEDGGKEVGAGSEVLDGAQKLYAVALLLERVIGGGNALNGDFVGLELKGLFGLGGADERAVDDKGGTDVLVGDLVIIFKLAALKNDLQRFKAAAVVELDKAEVLHIANGSDPAADGHGLAVKGGGIGVDAGNFLTLHGSTSFPCEKLSFKNAPILYIDRCVIAREFIKK